MQIFMYVCWRMKVPSTVSQRCYGAFSKCSLRLAKFLLAESERTAGSEIRLTHEQTAQALGTAREVVSRLIGEFSQEGMVRASRGCIHIMDRAALRRRADEGVGDRK